MRLKLTLVTFNHISRFLMLPVLADGRVRVSAETLHDVFGIRRGDCIPA